MENQGKLLVKGPLSDEGMPGGSEVSFNSHINHTLLNNNSIIITFSGRFLLQETVKFMAKNASLNCLLKNMLLFLLEKK